MKYTVEEHLKIFKLLNQNFLKKIICNYETTQWINCVQLTDFKNFKYFKLIFSFYWKLLHKYVLINIINIFYLIAGIIISNTLYVYIFNFFVSLCSKILIIEIIRFSSFKMKNIFAE